MQEAALHDRPSVLAVMSELQRLMDILQEPCRLDAESAKCRERAVAAEEAEKALEKARDEAYEAGRKAAIEEAKQKALVGENNIKTKDKSSKTESEWKKEIQSAVAKAKSQALQEARASNKADIRAAVQRAQQEVADTLIDLLYFAMIFDHQSPWGYVERGMALNSISSIPAAAASITPQDLEDISLAGRSLIYVPPGIAMSHADALTHCKQVALGLVQQPNSSALSAPNVPMARRKSVTWKSLQSKIGVLKSSDFFNSPPGAMMGPMHPMHPSIAPLHTGAAALPLQMVPSTGTDGPIQGDQADDDALVDSESVVAQNGRATIAGPKMPNSSMDAPLPGAGVTVPMHTVPSVVGAAPVASVPLFLASTPEEAAKSGANLAHHFFPANASVVSMPDESFHVRKGPPFARKKYGDGASPTRGGFNSRHEESKMTRFANGNRQSFKGYRSKKTNMATGGHGSSLSNARALVSPPSFTGDSALGIAETDSFEDVESVKHQGYSTQETHDGNKDGKGAEGPRRPFVHQSSEATSDSEHIRRQTTELDDGDGTVSEREKVEAKKDEDNATIAAKLVANKVSPHRDDKDNRSAEIKASAGLNVQNTNIMEGNSDVSQSLGKGDERNFFSRRRGQARRHGGGGGPRTGGVRYHSNYVRSAHSRKPMEHSSGLSHDQTQGHYARESAPRGGRHWAGSSQSSAP